MNSFVALMLTFRFSCNTYLSVCLCLSPKQNLCHPSYYVQSPSPRREHSIFTFLSLSLFQSSSIQRPAWAFQLLLVRRYFRSPHLCFHFCSFLFVGHKKVLEPKNNIFCFWTNEWNPICDVIQWSWSRGWLNANGLAQSKMKWMPPYISQSKWPGLDGLIVSRSMQSSISTVIVLTLKWLATLLFSLGR